MLNIHVATSHSKPPARHRINSSRSGRTDPSPITQVTDYLLKRGFNRTEEIFRQESKHLGPDGKPIQQLANLGPKKYQTAFTLLRDWVDNNLELYKVQMTFLPEIEPC